MVSTEEKKKYKEKSISLRILRVKRAEHSGVRKG